MKGGKGGRGRTNTTPRKPEKPTERGGGKKGAPKRDWGAVESDEPIDVRAKLAALPPKPAQPQKPRD